MENRSAAPYLEAREKEDAFLQRILEVIDRGIRDNAQSVANGGVVAALQHVSLPVSQSEPQQEDLADEVDDEYVDATLDFVCSF